MTARITVESDRVNVDGDASYAGLNLPSATQRPKAPPSGKAPAQQARQTGWEALAERLVRDGVPRGEVERVFRDHRMQPADKITFRLSGVESHADYEKFLTKEAIAEAQSFLARNRSVLEAAAKKYGVDARVIAAIFLVETRFGQVTGDELIVYKLARLSKAADPQNVEFVFQKFLSEGTPATRAQVQQRAERLERIFYPQFKALFALAKKSNQDIFAYRGSWAGAFGLGQFMPATALQYAVDGNGDGKISLYQIADAAHSTANYLSVSGWQRNQRRAVLRYNNSDAYADTVLAITARLK